MMYFSCDVAKQLDRARGYMDLDNFDYSALMGVDFGMDEYLFRLAVNKKYASSKVLDVLKQSPVELPAWDPMFAPDE